MAIILILHNNTLKFETPIKKLVLFEVIYAVVASKKKLFLFQSIATKFSLVLFINEMMQKKSLFD